MSEKYATFTIAFATVAITTPLVRWVSLKLGWVHRPDPTKWLPKANPHPRIIAMGGGLSIFAGILGAAFFVRYDPRLFLFIGLATCALALGVWDDLKKCHPAVRLVVQTLLGIVTGLFIGWVHGLPLWLATPVTIFGFVGLMNSVNMMDNMDGTASGLMALTMLGYTGLGMMTQNTLVIGLSLAVAGACLGFWLYNKPPATIFMGDAGSMVLGYLLALVGTLATHGEYPHGFARLFASCLLAGLFIADTTFVVIWRLKHGLPVMWGDKNHLSHRLATCFSHSEWKANSVLYAVQMGLNLMALSVAVAPLSFSLLSFAFGFAGLFLLARKLWAIIPLKSPALSR